MMAWMNQHKIPTALIVLWMLGLVTWVTLRVFGENPPDIPGSTATALGMVYGLPAIAVGLWKWRGGRLKRKPEDSE